MVLLHSWSHMVPGLIKMVAPVIIYKLLDTQQTKSLMLPECLWHCLLARKRQQQRWMMACYFCFLCGSWGGKTGEGRGQWLASFSAAGQHCASSPLLRAPLTAKAVSLKGNLCWASAPTWLSPWCIRHEAHSFQGATRVQRKPWLWPQLCSRQSTWQNQEVALPGTAVVSGDQWSRAALQTEGRTFSLLLIESH